MKIKTLIELEQSMTQRQAAEIALAKLRVQLREYLAEVEARYTPNLSRLEAEIAEESKREEAYLKDHKADFSGPPRSVTFASGTAGFRMGQKHLEPLSKMTWKKITELIRQGGASMARFLETKYSAKREVILADAERLGADGLRQMGLRVAQDDRPFVDIAGVDSVAETAAAVEGSEE